MKKVLALLLAVAMVFSLAACKDNDKKDDGKLEIGIILPTKEEDRWLADEAKFLELIKEKGYKADIMYSQASAATEQTNVEALIAKGIKVLIICPFDVQAAAATVKKARDEGIKVISYDRLITGTDCIDY